MIHDDMVSFIRDEGVHVNLYPEMASHPNGSVKMNVDGSCLFPFLHIGVGVVLRDHHYAWIFGYSSFDG